MIASVRVGVSVYSLQVSFGKKVEGVDSSPVLSLGSKHFVPGHWRCGALPDCTKQGGEITLHASFYFVRSQPKQIFIDHHRMSILCFPLPRQFLHIFPSLLSTDCTMVSTNNFATTEGWKTVWTRTLTHTKLTHTVPVAAALYEIFLSPLGWISRVRGSGMSFISALAFFVLCQTGSTSGREIELESNKQKRGKEKSVWWLWDFQGLTVFAPGSGSCLDDLWRCARTFSYALWFFFLLTTFFSSWKSLWRDLPLFIIEIIAKLYLPIKVNSFFDLRHTECVYVWVCASTMSSQAGIFFMHAECL